MKNCQCSELCNATLQFTYNFLSEMNIFLVNVIGTFNAVLTSQAELILHVVFLKRSFPKISNGLGTTRAMRENHKTSWWRYKNHSRNLVTEQENAISNNIKKQLYKFLLSKMLQYSQQQIFWSSVKKICCRLETSLSKRFRNRNKKCIKCFCNSCSYITKDGFAKT